MKLGKRIIKKTARVATKLLFVTLFTKAIKRGIIAGTRKATSVFKKTSKKAQ